MTMTDPTQHSCGADLERCWHCGELLPTGEAERLEAIERKLDQVLTHVAEVSELIETYRPALERIPRFMRK